jgi:hypothetical protein
LLLLLVLLLLLLLLLFLIIFILLHAFSAAHTPTQGYRTYYTVEASKMEPVFDEFMTHLYQDDPSKFKGLPFIQGLPFRTL